MESGPLRDLHGYEEKSKDEFHHELFAGVIMQDT
jgi:hypothetical protein